MTFPSPFANASFFESLAFDIELGQSQGIDAALKANNLDALVLPAPGLTTVPAAIAGYPIVTGASLVPFPFSPTYSSLVHCETLTRATVPMSFYPANVTIGLAGPETVYPAPGVPIGLSFLGTAFSEFELIKYAYAFEQATHNRLKMLAFPEAIPTTQLANIVGR